jgi:hypothetical protein
MTGFYGDPSLGSLVPGSASMNPQSSAGLSQLIWPDVQDQKRILMPPPSRPSALSQVSYQPFGLNSQYKQGLVTSGISVSAPFTGK